jgi:hypothetical protein
MDAVIAFKGACHCGAVRFTVQLTDGLRATPITSAGRILGNTASMPHALKESVRSIFKRCRSTTVRAIPRTDFL